MNKTTFVRKWTLANSLGFLIGYLLYTPIAHGITGGHDHLLTTAQLFAHCVALAVVATIIFLLQKSVLGEFLSISTSRVVLATIAFIVLFWLGYYLTLIPDGPDFDILFGYLALGAGMWFGLVPFKGNGVAWMIALFCFPVASFIGEVIFFLIVTGFNVDLDMQASMLDHTWFWITVGVSTGLIGGAIGGGFLYNMLEKKQ